MEFVPIKDERERIEGIIAEGFIDIRFVRYYTNEYGTYLSEILYDDITLFKCLGESGAKNFKRARLAEIENLAKEFFPNEEKIYYEIV